MCCVSALDDLWGHLLGKACRTSDTRGPREVNMTSQSKWLFVIAATFVGLSSVAMRSAHAAPLGAVADARIAPKLVQKVHHSRRWRRRWRRRHYRRYYRPRFSVHIGRRYYYPRRRYYRRYYYPRYRYPRYRRYYGSYYYPRYRRRYYRRYYYRGPSIRIHF